MEPRREDPPATEENPVVLPTREARQGSRGQPVMAVLLVGIALVVIAYVIVYYVVPTPGAPQ